MPSRAASTAGVRPGSRTHAVALLVFLAAASGCYTTEAVYLQSLEVDTPISFPPLVVIDTMESSFQLSVRVTPATGGGTVFEGSMPIEGPRVPDSVYRYPANNLVWTASHPTVDIDALVMLGRSVSLDGGMRLGGVADGTISGWHLGLGFFVVTPAATVRLEGGVRWDRSSFTAHGVAVLVEYDPFGSDDRTNVFFAESATETYFSGYGALTILTRFRNSPVNLFLQGGVSGQRFIDTDPAPPSFIENAGIWLPPPIAWTGSLEEGETARKGTTVWSLTPGVALSLGKQIQVLAGVRWGFFDIDDSGTGSAWRPFVQIDLRP